MRILYHHRIRSKDGQYVHIKELVNALRGRGHEVIVSGPPALEREKFGADAGWVAVLKRSTPRFLYELLEFGYALVDYHRLRKAALRHHPHCIYERYNLYLPTGVWLKRRRRIPMLLEINAPLYEERSRYGGLALKRLAQWIEGITWRGADRVLPVTRVLADKVRQAGVPESRISIVPNGVDPGRFANALSRDEAQRRLGLEGKLVLGFTGFVRDWHGLDRVMELLSSHRGDHKLHLLLVGDGPARKSLEQAASEHGVEDAVTITGIVDRGEVVDYIAAFDIALQPAVVDYASPLKLFEYLAVGRAVVAPATPNIREILTHEENALLFDPADPEAFRAAVLRLCNDDALRRRLGEAAKRMIFDEGLTWANNARRVEQLFEELGVHVAGVAESGT